MTDPLSVASISIRVRHVTTGALAAVVIGAAGCVPQAPGPGAPASASPEQPAPPIEVDSGLTNIVAPGVTYYRLFRAAGPWTIHVLDVDRTRCWTPAALKTDTAAVGRAPVSIMLGRARTVGDTVAAVNADFFLFNPPGVPTGAHVDDARVITGPGVRPVFAVDSAGRIHMGRLGVRGWAVGRRDSAAVTEWNHLPVTRIGVFDDRWGVRTDTAVGTLQVVIGRNGRVLRTISGRQAAAIPRGGRILVAGSNASEAQRRWLGSLRTGDSVRVRTSLRPLHPQEAVGGFPMILQDSALAPVLDSAHVRTFSTTRHPRTAVGVGRNGQRLLLVVVDGRRPGYSVGMTLPELARLMRELGARDALNLDGGGSSTMALRGDGNVHIVNRPSDPGGERPVANALAIVKGCPR